MLIKEGHPFTFSTPFVPGQLQNHITIAITGNCSFGQRGDESMPPDVDGIHQILGRMSKNLFFLPERIYKTG